MSGTITPFGVEQDPTAGQPFNALAAFAPKGTALPDDGSTARVNAATAKIDALLANAAAQQAQVVTLYDGLYKPVGDAAEVNAVLKVTLPLLTSFYDLARVQQLLASYRTTVVNWAVNHNIYRAAGVAAPDFPQPPAELLVYMPGLSF
jgi:hypothetical protein